MPESQRYITIKVKCPFCGGENEVYVDKEEIAKDPSGIIRIPIEHDAPQPHILVVDVDSHGFIRGAYLIKGYAVLERIPVFDVIDAVGIDNFAKLLCWFLAYDDIYIYGRDPSIVKLLRILLTYVFEGQRKIAIEEKARMKLDIFNIPQPEFSIDLILRRLRSAMRNIKDPKSLAAYLRHEVGKYIDYLGIFERVLKETTRKLTIKDLIGLSEDKLRGDEVKFLLAILRMRGIDVEKKVLIPEFKITEIF
mgnify:CR=1 FL=1